jgi:hypothetical protein
MDISGLNDLAGDITPDVNAGSPEKLQAFAHSNGVTKIGGWGGSIGATMLLLTEQMEEFDHLNMMIPVIDFDTVIFKNIYMLDAVAQFERAGFSESLLEQAYGVVNPVKYQLRIDPDRVQIMYSKYDKLTPENAMVEFAQKNNIKKIIVDCTPAVRQIGLEQLARVHGF